MLQSFNCIVILPPLCGARQKLNNLENGKQAEKINEGLLCM